MKLVNNDTEKCPYCGCDIVVSESVEMDCFGKVWQHCNGGKLEHRRFACGYESVFEPNFNRTDECRTSLCRMNNDYLDMERVSREVAKSIIKLINSLHCSNTMKDKILKRLSQIL